MCKWEKYGLYFGYPQCCINSFIKHATVPLWYESITLYPEGRKLSGTGYVPCPECNAKFTEKELIDNINKNRRHDVPFSKPHV